MHGQMGPDLRNKEGKGARQRRTYGPGDAENRAAAESTRNNGNRTSEP